MKVGIGIALLTTGLVVGVVGMHALHAQSSPKAYGILEIEVKDQAAYAPFQKMAVDGIKAAGGIFLAQGGKIDAVDGTPPKRIVITEWRSLADAMKYYNSETNKKVMEGRKASTVARSYVVEGLN
jgi:uncharacterized protein (DUF1330 family)